MSTTNTRSKLTIELSRPLQCVRKQIEPKNVELMSCDVDVVSEDSTVINSMIPICSKGVGYQHVPAGT